jgi:hypothetical protein
MPGQDTIFRRDPPYVINDLQLAEVIHKETDVRAGGTDLVGHRFLTDLRKNRLWHTPLPKLVQQPQRPHRRFSLRLNS